MDDAREVLDQLWAIGVTVFPEPQGASWFARFPIQIPDALHAEATALVFEIREYLLTDEGREAAFRVERERWGPRFDVMDFPEWWENARGGD